MAKAVWFEFVHLFTFDGLPVVSCWFVPLSHQVHYILECKNKV